MRERERRGQNGSTRKSGVTKGRKKRRGGIEMERQTENLIKEMVSFRRTARGNIICMKNKNFRAMANSSRWNWKWSLGNLMLPQTRHHDFEIRKTNGNK